MTDDLAARVAALEAVIERVGAIRCGICGNPFSEGSSNCVTDSGRPHVYDEADLRTALREDDVAIRYEWGVRFPTGNVEVFPDEAKARRFAISTTGLRPDLPTLMMRKTVTEWHVPPSSDD